MRNEKKIKEALSLTLDRHKVKEAFDKAESESLPNGHRILEGLDFQGFQELLVKACKVSRGVVHFKKTYSGESEVTRVFLGLWWEKLNQDKLKKQLGHFYSTFDFPSQASCFTTFDFALYSKASLLVNLLRSCFGMGK